MTRRISGLMAMTMRQSEGLAGEAGVSGGAAASARSGEGGAAADPREVSVEVAGVRVAGENTTVSVIVDEAQAGPLAARAATGRVVIVLDSRER